MSIKKFATYEAIERLWLRITQRYDKKLDSVANGDETITVSSGRVISVRVSSRKDNILQVDKHKGLFVPKNKKLTFGSDKNYVYDGTEDITVPVYNGEYNKD